MGVFSKYHRYREAGEAANVNNVEAFGEPALSLFSTSKVFTLHHLMDITDDHNNLVYHSETKFPSLHDKTDVTDANGNHISHIERKFFSLHHRHYVTMNDGFQFEIYSELFHLIKDIIVIKELGWTIRGNILALNFEMYDQNENIVAVISQKMLSIHDKFSIDIYQPEYKDIVVTILITLQHIIKDREAAASSSSSSSSSSTSK